LLVGGAYNDETIVVVGTGVLDCRQVIEAPVDPSGVHGDWADAAGCSVDHHCEGAARPGDAAHTDPAGDVAVVVVALLTEGELLSDLQQQVR
jgi:hypothetical protein